MLHLKGKLQLSSKPTGLVTRLRLGSGDAARLETLIVTESSIIPLDGIEKHGCIQLGTALDLFEPAAAGVGDRQLDPFGAEETLRSPVWDPYSGCVYLVYGQAVACLTVIRDCDAIDVVAGNPYFSFDEEDGDVSAGRSGSTGGFQDPTFVVSDGQGCLYYLCNNKTRIRRLHLPPSSKAGAAGAAMPGRSASDPAPSASATADPSTTAAPATGSAPPAPSQPRAHTSLLPFQLPSTITGLACDPVAPEPCLYASTATAVYRLPLPLPLPLHAPATSPLGHPTNGHQSGPAGTPPDTPHETSTPELLAGREDVAGDTDGRGEAARFRLITGLSLDGVGALIIADHSRDAVTSSVRRLERNGSVKTLLSGLPGKLSRPFVLQNGCLALSHGRQHVIRIVDLDLRPRSQPVGQAEGGEVKRTLAGDMGSLLDRQPDGTADLTLVAGDRRFPVHRAILIARCEFLRKQLESGYADEAAAELSLPDADPDAFALVLRWLYTGAADIPAALAPAVAELADRLLLPELCSDAQAVVLSGVSAETVVDLILWAESLGGPFAALLPSLKAWYVEHHEEVADVADAALERLAACSPRLMVELHKAVIAARRGPRR
ncbi:hypothetical protein HYH03_001913 [Edaphochlamys debaryana]|uniref:BTB domain-containing protein n=1 Tax=Edaphochlamys debaryana TaxID=47281 RepID=A0A836C5R8_9CHLO|nr:hypothetical protein HYH03_001913 [Edaphochlamys debaryana]|eukprot:KAG2500338.1 hypothetical protein HYH03_001913 [Edaphochlamys debaryana]